MALYYSDAHWSNDSLILCTSSSATSLLNFPEPIITTSLSLDRISLTESTPRFPSGHRPPLFTLIELRDQVRCATDQEAVGLYGNERVVVTTPTVPRMKVILEEKIVVNTWTTEVHPETPPCHTPWCGLGGTSESAADSLGKGLTSASTTFVEAVQGPNPKDFRKSKRSSSHSHTKCSGRNTLVLGHKILASTVDNRVSAPGDFFERLPATTVRTMQEKNQRTQGHAVLEAKHERNMSRYLPLQRASSPTSRKPLSLAVRRGHKTLPSLKLDQITRRRRKETTPYDSIPTAFRGSLTFHSPAFYQAPVPEPQGVPLTEMLESLREKCASFSSRVSLPVDWFYRPRLNNNDAADLSYAVPSGPSSGGDEWAVAGPLMEIADDSQPTRFGSPDAGSIPYKCNKLDVSCSPDLCGNIGLENQGLDATQNRVGGLFSSPATPKCPPLLRSSFVNPTSPRQLGPKVRKTVRFADLPPSHKSTSVDAPDRCADPVSPSVHLSSHQTPQTVTSSVLAPRDRPLSLVQSVQPAKPVAGNSWARGHTLVSPPPPQRPFSYRFPTYSKLPLSSTNGDEITQPWSSSALQGCLKDQQPPPEIVGKSPLMFSTSISQRSSGRRSLGKSGRYINKEPLKISNPIPITSVPRPKRNEDGSRQENGKEVSSSRNHVTTPLRNIFTRFK